MIRIPASLRSKAAIDGFSDAAQARKDSMHKDGVVFMNRLAGELNLGKSEYRVTSNVAGIAVSGEVTLHADHLYVQLQESCFNGRCLQLLYRSCKHRKDYAGGQNHFIAMADLADEDKQAQFLQSCRTLMQRATEQAPTAGPAPSQQPQSQHP